MIPHDAKQLRLLGRGAGCHFPGQKHGVGQSLRMFVLNRPSSCPVAFMYLGYSYIGKDMGSLPSPISSDA